MIDLTNRSFNAFYHPRSGIVYHKGGLLDITLFNSITNLKENVQISASEMATVLSKPRMQPYHVKLWDIGMINGGFVKTYHRTLMFDAHSFKVDDFSRSNSLVDFSFKMSFGFIQDIYKNDPTKIREFYQNDYWPIRATIQRDYTPSVLYRNVLSQSLPHSYFGAILFALDYLTYSILNEKTPADLNHRFVPITIPSVATLPLFKQSFSFDKEKKLEPLFIPYEELSIQ